MTVAESQSMTLDHYNSLCLWSCSGKLPVVLKLVLSSAVKLKMPLYPSLCDSKIKYMCELKTHPNFVT